MDGQEEIESLLFNIDTQVPIWISDMRTSYEAFTKK